MILKKSGMYDSQVFFLLKLRKTTVITRKLWNSKTTLYQFFRVFDVVTKQIVLLETY